MAINKTVKNTANEEIHYKTSAGQVVKSDGKTVQEFFDKGGNISGNINVKGNIAMTTPAGRGFDLVKIYEGDANGTGVAITGGGTTAIGGGESAYSVLQNAGHGLATETLYLTSDFGVDFKTNCNTIANAVTTSLASNGNWNMAGEIQMNGKYIKLTSANSGYARLGIDAESNDVFLSNYNNNWFRLKPDQTMTYAGYKVYTAKDKPTPADIGAVPSKGGTAIETNFGGTAEGKIYITSAGASSSGTAYVELAPRLGTAEPLWAKSLRYYFKEGAWCHGGSNQKIYHQGFKPTAVDVGTIKATQGHRADNWTTASAMAGKTFAGGYHSSNTANQYMSFGASGSNRMDIFLDGEFYANEGASRVYHSGWVGTIETVAPRVSSLNGRLASGWYSWTSGATGRPTDYGVLLNIQWTGTGDIYQFAIGSNNACWTRGFINGAWTSWALK